MRQQKMLRTLSQAHSLFYDLQEERLSLTPHSQLLLDQHSTFNTWDYEPPLPNVIVTPPAETKTSLGLGFPQVFVYRDHQSPLVFL